MGPVLDEVRAAVALHGGVSLAVYEAGVAHELYRAVRGEGAYGHALGPHRRFVVDVIAGTSAGGITGGLLAHALATGGDLGALRRLWLDHGGLGAFVYGPGGPVPSLLDGERLRAAIADALPPGQGRPLVDDLVAYLTLTDLFGCPVWYLDSLGHRILATTGRAHEVFRLADLRREPGESEAAYRGRLSRLVAAMRGTAAFPAVFPPQQLDGRWYVDGGVLDNKPLGLALRGARDQGSPVREHRALIFVEPHPTGDVPAPDPARTPHPLETLAAAVGLALDDSILEDLRGIDETNMRVEWYVRLREILDGFLAARAAQGDDLLADPRLAAPLRDLARQIRFTLALLGGASERWRRWQQLVPRLVRAGVDPFLLVADLTDRGAAAADLHLRWYRWLLHEMVDARLAMMSPATGMPDALRPLMAAPARPGGAAEQGFKAWLRDEVLQPVRAAWEASGIAEAVQAWVDAPPGDLAAGAAALQQEVERRRDRADLAKVVVDRRLAVAMRAAADPDIAAAYVDYDVFVKYETLSLVVEAAADLAGKRRIALVRISPRDADNLALISVGGPLDARRKLAGEVLGHFGGFLDRGWRRNDYIWGRLDAAEILLRLIGRTGGAAGGGRALVPEAQREILSDEHRTAAVEAGTDAVPADPLADTAANLPLIGRGRERFADLPPLARAHLFGYLLQTVPRMLRAPATLPGLGGVVRFAAAIGAVLRAASEPLLLLAAPGDPASHRRIWRAAVWILAATVVALVLGYAWGTVGLAAAVTWAAVASAALLLAFLLGAVAGSGRVLWPAAALLLGGVLLGLALRPWAEALWRRAGP